MTTQEPDNDCETLAILGDVGAASFVPWIQKHAGKLGLTHRISHIGSDRIELTLEGPLELIDAMEMGCSLGPIDVWVDTILRTPGKIERERAITN